MPKKSSPELTPTLVIERLVQWGLCIRTLRRAQRLRIVDLCERMSITHSTLRRLENGDPGAGAGLYLHALMVLGALEFSAPELPAALLQVNQAGTRVRVKMTNDDQGMDDDF
jgi:transcriptional regulator with XRE-family HTH domain